MLPKQNILNFTMTVFIKILGVQEAWSLGIIWLNTVVFLWILVKKHSVNISSNGKIVCKGYQQTNGFDPHQDQYYVSSDLDPNCLQRLSADKWF